MKETNMSNKILHVLYVPTLECNLHCSYCNVRCYSLPSMMDNRGKADIKKDMEMLVQMAKDKGVCYDFIIHGGELLLIEPKELDFIIEIISPYSHDIKSIKLQTNLTLLSDEHLKILIKHKDRLRRISTTLDFPKALHNKHRCNSYDKVVSKIRKVLEAGLKLNILSGIHNESVENLDTLISESQAFKKEFPTVMVRFNPIFGDGFTLTTENQIKLANFLINNNLADTMYNCNDIGSFLCCCEHVPSCDWVSFHNGVFSRCGVMGYDFDKNKIVGHFNKIISEECRKCSVVDICQGGCMGEKISLKIDKSPYCVFNKILLTHIKQKYGIKEVEHNVCRDYALSEQPI